MGTDATTYEVVDGFVNVGFEHELTDFLLRATQDELNATADPDDVTLFVDEASDSSITNSDENNDFAGDAIDVALSATSFFAGWINEPINGCQSGEYGRTNTPNEIPAADENTSEELSSDCEKTVDSDVKEILGAPSWRDEVTDQILVGLGLRQTSRIEGEYRVSACNVKEYTFTEVRQAESDMQEKQEDSRQDFPVQSDSVEIRSQAEPSVSLNNDIEDECVQVQSADATDVSIDRRDDLAETSCQRGDALNKGTDGKKNDVLKKLVAKCLARNKKSHEHCQQPKRLPLEPESCDLQLQKPEHPTTESNVIQTKSSDSVANLNLAKANNRTVVHRVRSDAPSDEIVSQENFPYEDIPKSERETRDTSILCSNGKANRSTTRDPPATCESQKRIEPQTLQLKMNTIGRSSTLTGSSNLVNANSLPRQEESALKLNMKSNGRAPAYYSQPPRPEAPFYSAVSSIDNDVARTTKKNVKETSPSSRQANTEEKIDTARMTLFRDSVLSPTALLRRKHYREMLLKERTAGSSTIE